jgi:hypothetical protein
MPTLRRTKIFALLGLLSFGALAACESPEPEALIAWSSRAFMDVGAACAFDSQCESQQCSADVESGGCGVCLDVRKLGERCDGPLQGCSASAICQNGVCQSTKKTIGESCMLGPKGGDEHECDDELYCSGRPGGQGACSARVPPGGACGPYTSGCVEGTSCTSGVCTLPPAGSCWMSGCEAGFFCDDTDTCRPATLPLGAPCGIVDGHFVDNECQPGTVCGSLEWPQGGGGPGTMSTCLPLPGAGELCIGVKCAEGLFCAEQTTDSTGVVPKRCEPLRAEGEPCSNNYIFHIDCALGLECRGDVCERACHNIRAPRSSE